MNKISGRITIFMPKLRQLFHQTNSVKSATLILVITLLLSNFLGLIRDHFLAQKIPTSLLDTYYAAFRIPDFIFNLFILGAITAAFIPVFTDYRLKNEQEAWKITSSFLNLAVLIVIICCLVLYFLMPGLIGILVAEFSAEKQLLTTQLARWLLLSPLFFSLSYIMAGILNSFQRFLIYSLAPLVYNLSIILATIVLADQYSVQGIVYGVLLGAFFHFLIQLPAAIKLGFRYQFIWDWTHQGVKKIITLMIPRAIGLGALQAMLLVYTAIAATLGAGAVAVFNLADNIQTMPMVVFGTSFATALFPTLSQAVAEKRAEDFHGYLQKGIRAVIFILVPASLGIILLRTEIVRIILGSGHFGWQQTIDTANILGIFMIALTAQGLVPLISRSFYALKNTKTPTLISVISIVISVICGYIFSRLYGILGLAMAFSLGSIINFLLLYFSFRNSQPDFRGKEKELWFFVAKVILATLVMGALVQASKTMVGSQVDMQRFWGVLVKTSVSIVVGALSYLMVCQQLKCEEIGEIKALLLKRFKNNEFTNQNTK